MLPPVQTLAALFTIVAGVAGIVTALIGLKISQQISSLRAEIAERYATKEDLRTLAAFVPTGPKTHKAAHA